MKTQVLSISQMEELVKLGIDTSNASVYWEHKEFGVYEISVNPYAYNNPIPAFTLQDIMMLLPRIQFKNNIYDLVIIKCGDNGYTIKYIDVNQGNAIEPLKVFTTIDPIDAAFNMLKWCKQNNYI